MAERCWAAVLTGVVALGLGCSGESRGPGQRFDLEIADAGVVLRRVPLGVQVERGADGRVTLVPQRGAGRIEFAMSDPVAGVVDPLGPARAVQDELARLPEGRFFGSQELRTPLGRAFTARGRFLVGAETVEQVRVVAAHPWGDRFLTAVFTYPASDDTADRVQMLLAVFGEVEGLPQPIEANS